MIGTILRQARLAVGIEQRNLAKELGISVFALNRVEHGKRAFDDSWVDNLPSGIRRPVVEALVAYHSARVSELSSKVLQRRA